MNYEKVRHWHAEITHHYTTRDTLLYALGVGAGYAPLDSTTLRYTYEKDLLTLPSAAAVLASPGFWMRDESALEINYLRLLHGEQSVEIYQPIPTEGTLLGRSRVAQVIDKGPERGAILTVEKQLLLADTETLVAKAEQVLFLRGDGGCGGDANPQTRAPRQVPERAADVTVDYDIRPEAALLYRLSGDLNPLHVDPAVAQKAGFERPILHGLANYGRVCFELIRVLCADQPERLRGLRVRFANPVFPGDRLRLSIWQLNDYEVSLEVTCINREIKVLSHGEATLNAP